MWKKKTNKREFEKRKKKMTPLAQSGESAAPPKSSNSDRRDPATEIFESGLNRLNQQVEGRTRGRGVEICIMYKQRHADTHKHTHVNPHPHSCSCQTHLDLLAYFQIFQGFKTILILPAFAIWVINWKSQSLFRFSSFVRDTETSANKAGGKRRCFGSSSEMQEVPCISTFRLWTLRRGAIYCALHGVSCLNKR